MNAQTPKPLRPTIPPEFAGKWIAWNEQRQRIVASGKSYSEAREAAELAGEHNPLLQKVPPRDVRFVGGGR